MASRRVPYADLETEARRAREEANRLARALDDVLNGAVVATSKVREPETGCTYTFRLCRPDAPDGGILLTTFHAPNQRPMTLAENAEAVFRTIADRPACFWAPLDHLRARAAQIIAA